MRNASVVFPVCIGCGRLIQVTHNEVVIRPALDALNLSDDVRQVLMDIQLDELCRSDSVLGSGSGVGVKVEKSGTEEVECDGDGEVGDKSGESKQSEKSGRKRRWKMTPEVSV